MKKNQAESKLCPFIPKQGAQVSGKKPSLASHINCAGNGCMAWQNTDENGTSIEGSMGFGYCKLIDKK